MKVAIYSRKSKFTDKGESIENQIKLCKEYAISRFNVDESEIAVYEDEGFSGGNTDRPHFQLMLQEAKAKKFNTLICYRLDRVSRNISDFSSLIDDLDTYSINFVSIREQFDTTTPMGKAMMYIASVFAQLERDTIAERIRDNMHQLAKTGRWLGGERPMGFEPQQMEVTDRHGNIKSATKLIPVPDEIEIVELLYDKYLEFQSLKKLNTYLVQNDFKTKTGSEFILSTIRYILTNAVYVKSDTDVYNYLINNNYQVFADASDFNGTGLTVYNKKSMVKQKFVVKDHTEWIIAPGLTKE